LEHIDAGDRLQVYIDEHDVVAGAMDHLDRFFAASGYLDDNAFGTQNTGAAFTKSPIVVDDEGAHLFGLGIVRGVCATGYVKVPSGQGAAHLNPVVLFIVDKCAARNFVIDGTNLAKQLTSAIASLYRLRICDDTQK